MATGPFQCGSNPDIRISSEKVKELIPHGESVVADSGYRGTEKCIITSTVQTNVDIHSEAGARHETVNRRLKNFSVLSHVF